MNILVICDDLWHPGEVIKRGLRFLVEKGIGLDFVQDAKDTISMDMLREYDVVITAKGDCLMGSRTAPWFEDGITAVMPNDYKRYVEEGGGYLSLHAGNAFNEAARPDMTAFTGNSFVTHPPQCDVTVEIKDASHPIVEGAENFTERDEHYEITSIAPDAHIFLESVSETGGRQVAGYTRNIGKGRLCVLTPGHNYWLYKNPSYATILYNAILWCAGQK